MKRILLILTILSVLLLAGCEEIETSEDTTPVDIPEEPEEEVTVTSFEECIEAGNPAMESYPRQCQHGDQTFVEQVDKEIPSCEDNCGDGQCAEMVCQAIGCPCSETPETCPQDCEVEPFCGDGECGKGEHCDNCLDDCGCGIDESCYENVCKEITCGRDPECNDDNACTRDTCEFPMHPNAYCSYEDIEKCKNGDDCCPADCNAENDNDCEPVCGNDICEEDENDTCDEDCEEPSECGNQVCEDGETYDSCPEDCV